MYLIHRRLLPPSLVGLVGRGLVLWWGCLLRFTASFEFLQLVLPSVLNDDGLISPWGSHGLAATLAPVLPCGYGAVKYCASAVVYEGAVIVETLCCVECGFLGPLLPLCVRVCMSLKLKLLWFQFLYLTLMSYSPRTSAGKPQPPITMPNRDSNIPVNSGKLTTLGGDRSWPSKSLAQRINHYTSQRQ